MPKGERPSNYKKISGEAQQNLVSLGYLHSNPFNFRNAVAINSSSSFFNQNIAKDKAIAKLQTAIQKCQLQEQAFYREISGGRYSSIIPIQKLLQKSTELYNKIKILNKEDFIRTVLTDENEQLEKIAKKWLNKQDYTSEDGIVDYKKMKEQLMQKCLVDYNIDLSKTGGKQVKSIKNANFVTYFKKRVEQIAPSPAGTYQKFYNKIRRYLASHGVTDEQVILAMTRVFERMTTNSEGKRINVEVNNQSNIIGFVGELLTGVLLDSFEINASQEFGINTNYEYIGDNLIKGKKAPIDFLIGKYGIQVKNSLVNTPFLNIKIQKMASIDYFVNRIGEAVNENELKYLLTNIAYLQYFGLPNKLKMGDISNILLFVNSMLSGAADILMSEEVNLKTGGTSYRNNFYFFKGKYLIPMSVILESIRDSVGQAQNSSSGYLGYINQNLGKEVKIKDISLPDTPQVIQLEKRNKLANLPKDEYTYGGELGRYGSELGNLVSKGGKIQVNYLLLIKNIDAYLAKIGII